MAPLGRFAVKRSLNGRIREARTAGSGREPPVRRWSQIDVSRRRTNAIHVPVQLEYEKTCIAPPIDRRGWMRASDDTRRVTAMPWTPSAPAPNLARGRPGAAARWPYRPPPRHAWAKPGPPAREPAAAPSPYSVVVRPRCPPWDRLDAPTLFSYPKPVRLLAQRRVDEYVECTESQGR